MKKKDFSLVILFINLSFLVLASCATTTFAQDFKRLKKGMEKGDVAERIGSPKRKDNHNEKEWWYYTVYENREKIERMVVFKENKMIYAGKIAKPPYVKDAAEDDKKTQAQNEELDAEMEKARVEETPMTSGPTGINEDDLDKK